MRYLITVRPKHQLTPDIIGALAERMSGWVQEHRGSGRLADVWTFAGKAGGGGIMEAASHEELESIMFSMPFSPWSSIDVEPLAAMENTLSLMKEAAQQAT